MYGRMIGEQLRPHYYNSSSPDVEMLSPDYLKKYVGNDIDQVRDRRLNFCKYFFTLFHPSNKYNWLSVQIGMWCDF